MFPGVPIGEVNIQPLGLLEHILSEFGILTKLGCFYKKTFVLRLEKTSEGVLTSPLLHVGLRKAIKVCHRLQLELFLSGNG